MKLSARNRPAPAQKKSLPKLVLQLGLIVFAVVLVYLPALPADFVWDDEPLITKNPLLQSVSGLGEIWSGGRTADYFPLTNTIFWLEWHLFGEHPAGYHAVNIFFQVANALLVWLVLSKLRLPGAWLAGLIFGIHPVHAESVAWISELKNLLSMFFGLLSFYCYLELDQNRLLSNKTAYALSLVFFVLALLAKTQLVILPVVLLLLEWWRGTRQGKSTERIDATSALARLAPFFFIALVLGLVTVWFQNRGLGQETVVLGSLSRRLVNGSMAVWWYIGKILVPMHLIAVYSAWRFDSPRWFEWLPLLALVAIVVLLWHYRERGTTGALFALMSFAVALLPVLGFVQMSYARSGTIVADHLQYIADVSLIALLSAGVAALWKVATSAVRPAVTAILVLLIGAMGTYTWARAEVYHDEESLWRDNLAKNPDAWQAHNRMGERFFRQERFAAAAEHFKRAADLKPDLADNYNQLGLAYCRLERFEEGIAEYRKGLSLDPAKSSGRSRAKIEANLANALTLTASKMSEAASLGGGLDSTSQNQQAMRRYEEAVAEYEKSLQLDPQQPAIHRNLGILLAQLGRYTEAIEHLRATLRLVPNEPMAREALDALEGQQR